MKDSANHLVARSQTVAHDPREQGKLLPVDVGIHKPNATSELAGIPKASLQLGMRFHTNRLSARPPLETTDIYLLPLHRKLITVNNTQ